MSAQAPTNPPPGIDLKDFSALSVKERPEYADQVAKLERKIFSKHECFDYDVELKKNNIGLILALKESDSSHVLVAYLVYQRMKRVVWLHKLCVIEPERRQGIGRCLVRALHHQMKKGGGENIQLWVDAHNRPARALYETCGFTQVDTRPAYYAPGRAGLKMELSIGG